MVAKITQILGAVSLVLVAIWPDFPADVLGQTVGAGVQLVLGVGGLLAWWKLHKSGQK